MKILAKSKVLRPLCFGLFLLTFLIHTQGVLAFDASGYCDGKQRSSACEKKVKKEVEAKCKKKTGSSKTSCEKSQAKKTAKRFRDKKAGSSSSSSTGLGNGTGGAKYPCGTGDDAVKTKFKICMGDDYSDGDIGPIQDLAFSIIKFLSTGVGLLVVASIIYAGIQYSASQGNPEATVAAKGRIQNAIIGLVIYMFIYAIVQYLVPGGIFASTMYTANITVLGFK